MRSPLVPFLVAAFLAGCPVSMPPHAQSSYPAEVRDFPELHRFPAEVSGYRRGEIIAYAPALSAFSVAYNRYDEQLQNAVTLYYGPRLNDTAAQLLDEKAAVINAHPDSRVISERALTLSKDGRTYEARLIAFQYTEVFAGRSQNVRSFLLVAFTSDRRFKVRSTTPARQADRAESNLVPLLEGVAWVQ